MSKEKPYQPSEEEMEKAEEMMTEEEKKASEKRELIEKEIEKTENIITKEQKEADEIIITNLTNEEKEYFESVKNGFEQEKEFLYKILEEHMGLKHNTDIIKKLGSKKADEIGYLALREIIRKLEKEKLNEI